MQSTSRERIDRLWLAQHCGKVTFRSRAHAWRVILGMAVRQRKLDLYLHSYECRWTARPPSRTAPPHIHVGHSKNAPWPRLKRTLRHWLVYPCLRARRELKIRLGLAERPPTGKKK